MNHVARAERFESEGKWEQAAGAYLQILRIGPRSVPALNRLGALHINPQKYLEGIEYYQQALKLDRHEFGTNLSLGIAYIKIQKYEAAAAPLKRAVASQPSNLQARQLLAVALIGQDDYVAAIPYSSNWLE